jgi:hypothetical protein
MERQLGRLVICEVGRKAILLIPPPDQPALDAARDQSDLRRAQASDSRASPSLARLPPRSRERGAGTAVQPSSPFRPGASLTRVRSRSVLVLRFSPESQFAGISS